jgi:hypothetical protein
VILLDPIDPESSMEEQLKFKFNKKLVILDYFEGHQTWVPSDFWKEARLRVEGGNSWQEVLYALERTGIDDFEYIGPESMFMPSGRHSVSKLREILGAKLLLEPKK